MQLLAAENVIPRQALKSQKDNDEVNKAWTHLAFQVGVGLHKNNEVALRSNEAFPPNPNNARNAEKRRKR